MACNHPLKAFLTGSLTDTGKDDYFISRQLGDLVDVKEVERHGHVVTASAHLVDIGGHTFLTDPIPIPCGRCVGCRLDYAKQWSTRCVLEMAEHPYNYFITLTYNEDCCPAWLSKSDLSGFMKRLRKALGYGEKERIRFFACGEYGTENKRPHYHIILFCERPLLLECKGPNVFHSRLIEKAWPFGFHQVSNAEPGACAYVAGYVNKKALVDPDEFKVPPFLLMSRRPGIGSGYLLDNDILTTLKVYGAFGSKTAYRSVPRFFKNKLGDSWKAQRSRTLITAQRQSDLNGAMVGTQDESEKGFRLDEIYKAALARKERKL